MQEHSHPATATVTLSALEVSGNTTLMGEQQRVAELAELWGLGHAQRSALHAVTAWAVFLRPTTDPSDREHLRNYLDVMGYLPADRKVIANAERGRESIEGVVPELVEDFARGGLELETFLEADVEQLSQRFVRL